MRVPKGNGWNARFRNLFNSVRNKNSGGIDAKGRKNSSSYILAKSLENEGMGQLKTYSGGTRDTWNSTRKPVFKFSETVRHFRDGFKDLDDKLNQAEKEYMDKLLASKGGSRAKANTPAPPTQQTTTVATSPAGDAKREIKAHDATTSQTNDQAHEKIKHEASEICRDITGGEEGYWEDAENETLRFQLVMSLSKIICIDV